MAIRRSQKRWKTFPARRGSSVRRDSRKVLRQMQLESLEARQLLALGPQLAGIQLNDGEILRQNDTRHVAPRELTFQFQDGVEIDAATLDAIQVTRTGSDGEFSAAAVRSDLNTDGRVLFEFRAESLGQGGNGITLTFTQTDRGGAAPPTIDVDADTRTISVDLNSNLGNQTRAGELVNALNGNSDVRSLLRARIVQGSPTTRVGATNLDFSPLVLQGANTASATSDLGVSTPLQVKFFAAQPGQDGNGIAVQIRSADLGAGQPPSVSVDDEQREVTIVVNSRPGSESTVEDVVEAVNSDTDVSAVVRAAVEIGDRQAIVGDPALNLTLVLSGSSDVVIEPGAIFVDDSGRRVVLRFKENLPDDTYRIDVFGAGQTILRDLDGEPFEDGQNFGLEFELDLGPQVLSVVPQPIVRDPVTGELAQRRRQVVVYFNDDDLDRGSATDPDFYRLIFTRETVENTDDLEFAPVNVEYSAELDRAVLTFADELDQLPAPGGVVGAGTFRLRIGTDEPAPLPPLVTELNFDPGSSYDSALAVGTSLVVEEGADGFAPGQVFTVTDDARTNPATTTFVIAADETIEMEAAATLVVPPSGGRIGGIGAEDTITVNDGAVERTFEFTRGSAVAPTHVPILLTGNETAAQVAQKIKNAIDVASLDVITTVLAGGRVHVGGGVDLDVSQSGVLDVVESRQVVLVAYDPAAADDAEAMSAVLAAAINNATFDVLATSQSDEPLAAHANAALDPTSRIALTGAAGVALETGFQGLDVNALSGLVIRSEISSSSFNLEFPGAPDEPGHRQIPIQSHTTIPPDSDPGITTVFYNFQENYGVDDRNNPLTNAITENQKDRAREIFEIFGEYLGIQFVETPNLGYTIVTGDLRVIDPAATPGPGGILGLADPEMELAIMDAGELDWDDTFGATDVPGAFSWFEVAMEQIATLLGFGRTDELPAPTLTGSEPLLNLGNTPENIYPGDHDIVHGQLLYRPDNIDIDLYRIDLPEAGTLTVETFAERQEDPSLLDTAVTVFRELRNASGQVIGREVVARNDDYYSEDSYLQLRLESGTYYVGVSASGNNIYDPTVPDSGLGGTSEGDYRLRLDFQSEAARTIVDQTGNRLDGDNDGLAGGQFDYWFRSQTEADTIYVDRSFEPGLGEPAPNGTLDRPYNNLAVALADAAARGVDAEGIGAVVRVVGNQLGDPDEALAHEIGFHRVTGRPLRDGSTLEVPQGVSLVIDSGAVLKLRRVRIGVGSSSPLLDRSGGSLQLLGTPRVVLTDPQTGDEFVATDALTGAVLPGSVYLTSIHDPDIGVDTYVDANEPDPDAGDWGGIVFRNDIDRADRDRVDAEREGMFLNHVNHGDFRYGGGDVVIVGQPRSISPIHMIDARPTVSFNQIQHSGEAALSANPDSFEETNFHAAPYQNYATDSTVIAARFTSDYDRVGPHVHNNTLTANSLNGLFVRLSTRAGGDLEQLTVPGRFDDIDIVHVLQENLVIAGTPGGPLQETGALPVALVTLTPLAGGSLAAGTYSYRLALVDAAGNEGPLSAATNPVDVASGQGSVRLRNLAPITPGFVARRLYRSIPGNPGSYVLVGELDPASTSYVDNGATRGGRIRVFDPTEQMTNLRPRLDARLALDPGTIVKLDGARIETGIGAQLLAEGVDGNQVVFTSLQDDLYGFGGTFDTNNNAEQPVEAQPGDWGGVYVGHLGTLSMDHAVLQYGGGTTRVEGTSAAFNALEIHQASARVAHTEFRLNADGLGGAAGPERIGRGANDDAVIFVRAAQPILWANRIDSNEAAAINIDTNSLNHRFVSDFGRSTYPRTGLNDLVTAIDLVPQSNDNQGPLVYDNRLGGNELNGMRIRGATLTTQGVWDDTSIAHVLLDEQVTVPDLHTFGGLRLESDGTSSLVVKLAGPNAGFETIGRPLDIDDRIGGSLQVVGTERYPVIITSLRDDAATAGFDLNGLPLGDTNGDATETGDGDLLPTGPEVDNGILIDNDVPVDITGHFEIQPGNGGSVGFTAGPTSSGVTAQGNNQLFTNADWIFDFTNYIDVGADGAAVDLGSTTVTMPPTLVADDLVASEGTFAGANGTIAWRAETRLDDGVAIVYNTITFTSLNPLGDLQFINYLDEDVEFVSDDLLYLVGTPGQPDFRAFTLDDAERVGFSQAGFYEPGPELQNATYVGWAADQYADLQTAIEGPGTAYTIPGNIDTADLIPFNDPSLGQVYGLEDITTAFAWAVDPMATSATITSFLELVPRDPATSTVPPRPGDWGALTLSEFTHDRNVDVTVEREPKDIQVGADSNQDIRSAEFLGQLAPHDKAGDDTLRLGFELHGLINRPDDVDVYSFDAQAGTEIWLDLDRTAHSLDSVVELLDGDGNVIALSDNSRAETDNPGLLFHADNIPENHVNPLQKSVYQLKDYGSTNPRDAGMRVVLPGTPGDVATYHVRVRSSNLAEGDAPEQLLDPNLLHGGRTSGPYQLQVRLRELDEVPGTTVQFADIRYSTNGIRVSGAPVHSPLAGEVAEQPGANDSTTTAQDIGNLLNSDRGTLGIAGSIGDGGTDGTDVDFYRFEVTYDSVAATGGHFPVVFDLDYAGADLGRANTVLSIFDSAGNLILSGADSNIAEDRPGPLAGPDLEDLSRGTVGPLDPFIGTVELPVGEYFLAVSSNIQVPRELEQFLVADPSNPLLRLEPIDSLAKIAEDHLDFGGGSTAVLPQVPVLIEPEGIVPFHLGDVNLFVSQDTGLDNSTRVLTVDPFTGAAETLVGTQARDFGDLAMRQDGQLFSFTLDLDGACGITANGHESICPSRSDADAGNFIQIDTGNGALALIGDDGIETFNEDFPLGSGAAVQSNPVGGGRQGHGIHFEAVAFADPSLPTIDGTLSLFGIGHRPQDVLVPGVQATQNILYRFNRTTGAASSSPQADRTNNARINGAGTQIVERAALVTSADPMDPDGSRLIAVEATRVDPINGTVPLIDDGMILTIDHDGLPGTPGITFEFNSGPDVFFEHDPDAGIFARDEDFFVLDARSFEFNTGAVVVVTADTGAQVNDGDTLTIVDRNGIQRTFEFDRNSSVSGSNVAVPFTFAMNQQALVNSLINTINGVPNYTVQAEVPLNSNRVTLLGDSRFDPVTFMQNGPNGPAVEIQGDNLVMGGTEIRIEETFNRDEFANAILTTFNGSPGPPPTPGVAGITASRDGARINFDGAQTGDFTFNMSNPNVFTQRVADGVLSDPMHLAIDFQAADSAAQIAARITQALNNFSPTPPDTQTIDAVQDSIDRNVIILAAPSVGSQPNTSPILVAGAAPGGLITGATFLGTRMFAVTDTGGLFEIVNYNTDNATAVYIDSSAADLRGINFQGLTAGPPTVENGAYANMLFAISGSGRLFAFNTAGELQPVFVDGASSIQTELGSANGLAFSTSDQNLWQVGDFGRGGDAGHGLLATYDGSRSDDIEGGLSLHFGRGLGNTYDVPGGAHGTVETLAFDLSDYSAADQPMLYFTYYLDTENANSTLLDADIMRDAFRVYVVTEDGTSHLVATNNSDRGPFEDDDEYDDFFPDDDIQVDVQQLFDVGDNGAPDSWRQARIPLGPFTGMDNLRLRFDFNTSGDSNLGDPRTTGAELRAIAGAELRDGQTFEIDDTLFEFDLGYTFVAPTGAALRDEETFRIGTQVYEFDSGDGVSGTNIRVPFDASQSAAEVAATMEDVILSTTRQDLVTANITERNDTLEMANESGLIGGFQTMTATSRIGDNPNLVTAVNQGRDVDILSMELNARDRLMIQVDSSSSPDLDTIIRLFDAAGNELAFNDDGTPPDGSMVDSYLDFTVPSAGTYYLGISAFGNATYDPFAEASGTSNVTGVFPPTTTYDVQIDVSNESGLTRRDGNRLTLPDARSVTENTANLILEGAPGTTGAAVTVHPGMSDQEVAQVIRQALADSFAGGNTDAVKISREVVKVIGHTVTEAGPLGLTELLIGDIFGNFNSNQRGQDNAHEGVYVDDIVVGFAERGEMVTGAVGDSVFADNPLASPTEITVGPYQVEMRRGAGYGTTIDETGLILDRAFDTNDRLAEQHTLLAPRADQIAHRQTFTLSDGIDSLTFEYLDVTLGETAQPGNVPILFDPAEFDSTPNPDFVIAQRIRDAINSPAVQAILDITAASSEGTVSGATGSHRINLFGNVVTPLVAPRVVISDTVSNGNSLRDALLGGSPNVLPVGDASFDGSGVSAGLFEGGGPSIGIEAGIILSTGNIFAAEGPNVSDLSSGLASEMGDPDLDREFGLITSDSTVLEFTVNLPEGGDLAFDFVFASEEYNEGVNSAYNDVFGLFIEGPGLPLRNLAYLPDDITPISVNTVNGGGPVFGDAPSNPEFYNNNDLNDLGGFLDRLGYDGFTDVLTARQEGLAPGEYTIKFAISDVTPEDEEDQQGDSAVFIRPLNVTPGSRDRIEGIRFDDLGDRNLERDQGQLILKNNRISNTLEAGILIGAGDRDVSNLAPLAGDLPHPGPPRNLRELNTEGLLPGVTVTNNIIDQAGSVGIGLSGEVTPAGAAAGPVPFARILNNTVVGDGQGVGIQVTDNASPTLLNNVVVGWETGLLVDDSSDTTVVSGTLYSDNASDFDTGTIGAGDKPLFVADASSLFVDPANGNFYPAPGSRLIDSAVDSLQERAELVTVKNPLGIAPSPVLAPDFDALGQKRLDDRNVDPPAGQGRDVFKDRGAIDRADFFGPDALLLTPRDNDAAGDDLNPQATFVEVNAILDRFSIQLLDGVAPSDAENGSGLNDPTVTGDAVTVLRDGQPLVQGEDYRFAYDAVANVIHLVPLVGIWATEHEYTIILANEESTVITVPDVETVLDGDQFDLTDASGNFELFEFETGYTIQVPQTLTLTVPANGGADIGDGDTFTVSDGTTIVTFEFDRNDVVGDDTTIIDYTLGDSAAVLAASITQALIDADLQLAPVNLGGGMIHLGSQDFHSVNVGGTSLVLDGVAGGVADEDTFLIDDGVDDRVVFEFNTGGSLSDVDHQEIEFDYSNTHEEIAQRIVAAIAGAGLNLNPRHLGDGLIQVGGSLLTLLDTSGANLTQTGQGGVQPAFGLRIPTIAGEPDGVEDEQTFTISDGTQTLLFELDTDGRATPGREIVSFAEDATTDQIAAALVDAVEQANLGLNPVHLGGGLIELGGDAGYSLGLGNTVLLQLGTPGAPAATAVPFVPDPELFTSEDLAVAIAEAINGSQVLEDVTATANGLQVEVRNIVAVNGLEFADVPGITDLAGNVLQPNRVDGSTVFNIFVGQGLDYGDAPDPTFPTLESNGGPSHVIVPGFSLGDLVDSESDGQPTNDASGDGPSDDGVTFTRPVYPGFETTLRVTASGIGEERLGFLDAWIDFNGDGVWDATEQVADALPLNNGVTFLDIQVPSSAVVGGVVGRFRLSTTGGLGVTGAAADGEVEDHLITVSQNPWQNRDNRFDVNGDGKVTPIDALFLVNLLNATPVGAKSLDASDGGPPFYDVIPDGIAAPSDLNAVITELNRLAGSRRGGEGEGESGLGVTLSRNLSDSTNAALPSLGETPLLDPVISELSGHGGVAGGRPSGPRDVALELPPRLGSDHLAAVDRQLRQRQAWHAVHEQFGQATTANQPTESAWDADGAFDRLADGLARHRRFGDDEARDAFFATL